MLVVKKGKRVDIESVNVKSVKREKEKLKRKEKRKKIIFKSIYFCTFSPNVIYIS
jgi:hypothetical protein